MGPLMAINLSGGQYQSCKVTASNQVQLACSNHLLIDPLVLGFL